MVQQGKRLVTKNLLEVDLLEVDLYFLHLISLVFERNCPVKPPRNLYQITSPAEVPEGAFGFQT